PAEGDPTDPHTWPTAPADGRHRDDPARRQSASFFVTELLSVDEFPHRAVIDLEATLSEFAHQPAHGKILPAPLHQPFAMRPRNLLWPIATDLVRLDAAGLVEAPYPVDRRADAHPKLGRRLMPRQAPFDDSLHHPLTKVVRIRSSHPCWPPIQASMLNQNQSDLGILNRFILDPSRSSAARPWRVRPRRAVRSRKARHLNPDRPRRTSGCLSPPPPAH